MNGVRGQLITGYSTNIDLYDPDTEYLTISAGSCEWGESYSMNIPAAACGETLSGAFALLLEYEKDGFSYCQGVANINQVMQGLRALYEETGRRAAWRRLVEAVVPDFVDSATDGPLPGREDNWTLVTQYRLDLAREERKWPEAERLQRTSRSRHH